VDWWRAGPGKLPLPGRLEGGEGATESAPCALGSYKALKRVDRLAYDSQ
ncbi:MAG: hypothetical protein RIR86_1520, partial [Acidobacteriota bacterium]